MMPLPCLALVAILLLSFQFQPPRFASGNSYATVCGKTGKYRAKSTYQANVQYATSYLANYPTFTAGTGFATVVYGDSPDAVYGLALCRGDTPDNVTCYECLSSASNEAQILCPYYKDSALFYDGCVMRFSDQDFLSTTDNAPEVVLNSTEMVKPDGVARGFDALVARLLNETAEHAAESQNPNKKMATGEAVFDAGEQTMKVYSLAQCTPDLTVAQCRRCLGRVMARVAQRIPGVLGNRVAGVRCNVRFEVYPFYIGNATVRIEGLEAPSPAPLSPLLPPPPPQPEAVTPVSPPSKGGIKSKIWIIAVPASISLLFFCVLLSALWIRSRHRGNRNMNSQLQEAAPSSREEAIRIWRMEENSSEFSLFEFSQIADATSNFSEGNKLGEGGFGRVYKGHLPNGLDIAVKRLAPHSVQGLNEFKTEIQLIAKLQHTNLVRLLGCCIQGEEKLLIYEYMSNKSLDFFIFGMSTMSISYKHSCPYVFTTFLKVFVIFCHYMLVDTTRGALLNWNRRRHIIEGVAQGLIYLHKHSRLRVIHRDLKASNILLDDNMNPKISDFGLARIFGSNETHANTSRVVGTHGYMAPEYASEGLFSIKSDVFSFGVLLLEIISGKRNVGFHQTGNFSNLLGYAWLLWKDEKWCDLIDACLDVELQSMEIMRFINVALMCVQDNAVDRPTMSDVITMLTNESISLPEPKQPAYFNTRVMNKGEGPVELDESNSVNDATISLPDGR